MTMTGEQCKIARKLLGWSLEELAQKVKMSEMDVARFEAGMLRVPTIGSAMIGRVLEQAGVEFVGDPLSARLRKPR
jgi:ribosome-binding protein aMBF1 (putative translation factor)